MSSQNSLEQLGEGVRNELDAWPGASADLASARQRLLLRPLRARRGFPTWAWITAGAFAATATILVLRGHGEAPLTALLDTGGRPQLIPVGQTVGGAAEQIVSFSEGTRVSLTSQSSARLERLDARGADFRLEKGNARIVVTPNRRGLWHFRAGSFEVRVTGTRFDLAWDPGPQRLRVNMAEGSVVVSGGCLKTARVLAKQEALDHSCAVPQVVAAPPRPSSAESSAALPAVASAAVRPRRVASVSSEPIESLPLWKTHYLAGRYVAALSAAERAGFDRECERVGAMDVLALGDIARLARAPRQAELAYRTVRTRFAGRPISAQAAYLLGRLLADEAQRLEEAGRWFSAYLREEPRGDLAPEAAGRLMDTQRRLGHTDEARRLARMYLARYPEGAYSALARSLIGP